MKLHLPQFIQARISAGEWIPVAKRSLEDWARYIEDKLIPISVLRTFQPPSLADADAPDNSVYYSTTASKLVYKDSGGVVHNLY